MAGVMAAVDRMAVEAGSIAEAVPTAVEDFTEVVGSTVEAGFTAGAASEAELDSAAAARFAEERDFAEGQDFAVEGSAAAFAETASAVAGAGADGVGVGEVGIGMIGASVLAGAGLMDIGPDTRIRTDTTTLGGRRLITRPAMIPITILPILTTTRHLHTQIGLTRIDIATAGTRIRHRRALQ
jgi:hypothetical protein